jgi:hypothetical protein
LPAGHRPLPASCLGQAALPLLLQQGAHPCCCPPLLLLTCCCCHLMTLLCLQSTRQHAQKR